MCANFTKKGIPLIEAEFGEHMEIIKYDMDDDQTIDEVKKAYDQVLAELIDFDEDYYGTGPFLVLEGYFAQLGVSDVNKYLDNLIAAINDRKLNKAADNETYYFFKLDN